MRILSPIPGSMTSAFSLKFIPRFQISIVLLFVTGLIGCQNIRHSEAWINFNSAKIEALLQKQKTGATVYLQGKVENQAPFLGAAAYQLQDNTGSIWVFTTQPLPDIGQEMLIRGKVEYKSIQLKQLNQKDIGDVYVKELERLDIPKP